MKITDFTIQELRSIRGNVWYCEVVTRQLSNEEPQWGLVEKLDELISTLTKKCPSCQVSMIQGVRCHELGCPDAWRDEVRVCHECGCEFTPTSSRQLECSTECHHSFYGTPYKGEEE